MSSVWARLKRKSSKRQSPQWDRVRVPGTPLADRSPIRFTPPTKPRLNDAARTAWLEERGYKVIRFDAGEVGRNLAGVLAAIRAACTATAANSAGR